VTVRAPEVSTAWTSGSSTPPRFYLDVLEVWRPWAADVQGAALDASHFIAEDEPEQTAAALRTFLAPPR
jgi:haloacetate dehalogenase